MADFSPLSIPNVGALTTATSQLHCSARNSSTAGFQRLTKHLSRDHPGATRMYREEIDRVLGTSRTNVRRFGSPWFDIEGFYVALRD
jgi:hypothetical protein